MSLRFSDAASRTACRCIAGGGCIVAVHSTFRIEEAPRRSSSNIFNNIRLLIPAGAQPVRAVVCPRDAFGLRSEKQVHARMAAEAAPAGPCRPVTALQDSEKSQRLWFEASRGAYTRERVGGRKTRAVTRLD